jgi:class 3 adenylate cyclase/AmiR/NasT family two-component response regulator
MAKILVADDETDLEILIKQKFRKQIREKEYEFFFAYNGAEAIRTLQSQRDIDMVLSDINMPEVDGLTLLTKLHDISPLLKAVIVSAYGDMDNIRTAMNRGAFDFLCKPINFEDLELTLLKTLEHVKHLRDTFQAIKENNILKMYVDENVLHFMNRPEFEAAITANETIDATVVFIDICGFTSISENESPDVVVGLVNKYFDVMVKEIIDQNGYIDKFMGDAVMAIFRGEFHLDRAIEACLSVRKKIQAIKEPIKGKPDYLPNVSIGINSGEMISGNIGSTTLKRLDYTVIGDTVNLAQRLQSAASPSQILISETSFKKVGEAFNCKKIGEITVKNKAKPIMVYEVLA